MPAEDYRPRAAGTPLPMSTEENPTGYPEEQPAEVDEGQSSGKQESDATPAGADGAPGNEDGTATGNPGAAGAGE